LKPHERLVAAGDTKLLVREWGDEGPPILFWHALGDHTSLQMAEAGPILAREFGYRVLGIDAPGFGGSPRLPDDRYEIPALVELAHDLLDTLGYEQPAWSGSSWGAIVGLHLAATHPARLAALALLDGGYLHTTEGQTLDELKSHWRAQDGFRYASWDALFEEARNAFGRWSPALETYVRASFVEQDGAVVSIMGPDVYAASIYGVERMPPWDAFERLGKHGLPVLLVAATDVPPELAERRASGLERVARLVPQAEIVPLERAPHFLLEACPEKTAGVVGRWLRSLPYE
jgi:pimeloyl-ACP methyl ester carboxylesterase